MLLNHHTQHLDHWIQRWFYQTSKSQSSRPQEYENGTANNLGQLK